MAIAKITLTVTSSYAAAPAPTGGGGLNLETWGYITLWDVRPFLPWESRGILGWGDYLERTAVMDSTQAPDYGTAIQGPKSWPLQTNSVVIYDTASGGSYKAVALYNASLPYTYTPDSDASETAFDATSTATVLDTLVLACYGMNSQFPEKDFPVGTDVLSIYKAYIDIELDDHSVTRYVPLTATVIEQGPVKRLGEPTDVLNPENAVDASAGTCAVVRETNGFFMEIFPWFGYSSLWHPAILLLENWATEPEPPEPPRQVHSFWGVISTGRGRNASFSSG